jgi:thiosulfate reductase cytochrome b subunit
MSQAAAPSDQDETIEDGEGHRVWVRISHWVIALSFIVLGFSGIFILAVHPRLYWGEVGNDLVPALLEIPITNNHQPDGFERTMTFTDVSETAFTANRTYEIFNQNGWARSLHFLAAWFFLLAGFFYALLGFVSGHLRRHLLPRGGDFSPREFWQDVKAHLRPPVGNTGVGPPYGLLQRVSYFSVAFVALPLMVVTGLAMSPAITAALPILLDVFGGYQSARTIHFFCFAALALFLVVHIAMVIATGFRRQLRAMTLGDRR